MTMLEKIIALHANQKRVKPGDIVDVEIDARVARDFGGPNVVKNLQNSGLTIADSSRTFFTFDCNPTGSDQKYAVNQHICRIFARENDIRVFDINAGIGTHLLIDEGLVYPGATAVSTDSHANILGAVGAFGQGMGDMDIAAAWNKGRIWFKVPASIKLNVTGTIPDDISAKDIVLNLLKIFGANRLLGFSVEITGEAIEKMTIDERITISSMATEMGAIIILFSPSNEIIEYCSERVKKPFTPVFPDRNAHYEYVFKVDAENFRKMVSRPGEPHDTAYVTEVLGTKIDSAFIGSCTNGRMTDMRAAASILKNRKVAPGVILKIVPATDEIWNTCLEEGLLTVFKNTGALVSNAGCAGCAAGQVGQNGPGEVTISTGNRNFPGKQGKGDVYLASPDVVAASAVAGFITTPDRIPDDPAVFKKQHSKKVQEIKHRPVRNTQEKPVEIEGRIWLIRKDNIDTDMIFHNRYLAVTNIGEMGQYTFDNFQGHENFASKVRHGDIVVAGKNFGCGSSRQQAVDCFKSLGIQAIVAESFGSIYERNAINAAFPVVTSKDLDLLDLEDGNKIRINFLNGEIENLNNEKEIRGVAFSAIQLEIYQKGGLL